MDIPSASASTASGDTSQKHPHFGIIAEIETEVHKLESESTAKIRALLAQLKEIL